MRKKHLNILSSFAELFIFSLFLSSPKLAQAVVQSERIDIYGIAKNNMTGYPDNWTVTTAKVLQPGTITYSGGDTARISNMVLKQVVQNGTYIIDRTISFGNMDLLANLTSDCSVYDNNGTTINLLVDEVLTNK